jgi:hypothetical protein
MIIKNVTDMVFFKTNQTYKDLCDELERLSLELKDVELNKLMIERKQLEAEYKLRALEEEIARYVMKAKF